MLLTILTKRKKKEAKKKEKNNTNTVNYFQYKTQYSHFSLLTSHLSPVTPNP
jgi:hypothetical protein